MGDFKVFRINCFHSVEEDVNIYRPIMIDASPLFIELNFLPSAQRPLYLFTFCENFSAVFLRRLLRLRDSIESTAVEKTLCRPFSPRGGINDAGNRFCAAPKGLIHHVQGLF